MAKKRQKKKAAKNRSHRQPNTDRQNPDKTVRQIREALEQNLVGRAWGAAMPFVHTAEPEPTVQAAVIDALDARVTEMVRNGNGREAARSLQKACAAPWLTRDALDQNVRLLVECAGGKPHVLNAYEEREEIRQAADRLIRTTTALLVQLNDHPSLDPDHPLRRGARLICEAWADIEREAAGRELGAPETLPEDSPFADWWTFLQALNAFYNYDDETALTTLETIAADAAPAPLAQALCDLVTEKSRKDRWFKKLREATSSGRDVRTDMMALEELFESRQFRRACREADRLAVQLDHAGRRSLATDVYAYALWSLGVSEGDEPNESFRHAFAMPHLRGRLALAMARCTRFDKAESPNEWIEVLENEGDDLSSIEKAIVHRYMATLTQNIVEERSLDNADEEMDEHEEAALERLREQVEESYETSVRIHPLAQTFENWFFWRWRNEQDGYPILMQWRDMLPEDEDVFYWMICEGWRDGRTTNAREALEALKAIREDSMENIEAFVVLLEAGDALKHGQLEAAEAMFGSLDIGSDVIAIAVDCVRYLHADPRQRQLMVTAGNALAAWESPYLVWHCMRKLRPPCPKDALPEEVRQQFDDPEMVLASFGDVVDIEDVFWQLHGELWSQDIVEAARKESVSSTALLDCLGSLVAFDPAIAEPENLRAFLTLTAAGIRHNDNQLSDFLAYRARIYIWLIMGPMGNIFDSLPDMAADCAAAALRIADRHGNHGPLITELAEEVTTVDLPRHKDAYADEDIEEIIEAVGKAEGPLDVWYFDWHEANPASLGHGDVVSGGAVLARIMEPFEKDELTANAPGIQPAGTDAADWDPRRPSQDSDMWHLLD